MNRFVVITGLPASGKSSVGRILARGLSLPLLDKDEFLESLFESAGVLDDRGRQELSRVADDSFRARAMAEPGAILVSWWRHPRSLGESGTPCNWLPLLPGALVEVHCACSASVAAERFLARKRHPGHLDAERSYGQILERFKQQAQFGPLGAGALVEVNTDEAIDTAALLCKVHDAFQERRH